MTKTEKAVMIYGLSVGGAALASYLRGNREFADLSMDAIVHGGIVGTGINVVLYLQEDAAGKKYVTAAIAQQNGGQSKCEPYGKIGMDGLKLLSMVNPEKLYKAVRRPGVSVDPEGEDPNRVTLPPDE